MWAIYPQYGMTCTPNVYPHQFTALMYMDFLYSVVDIVITLFLPRKLDVIKHQRKIRGSLLGEFHLDDPTDEISRQSPLKTIKEEKRIDFDSNLSEVSSLDGDGDKELLNPERR